MSRKNSPLDLGDCWLSKRFDGQSDVWQIVTYNPVTRSNHHHSTNCRSEDEAKQKLRAFYARLCLGDADDEEDAHVVPLLLQYHDEHAVKAISADSLCSNIRTFTAFLMQDELGLDATISRLKPYVFERFREWRMSPHSYKIVWQGKLYEHSSQGVVGETVNKNLDDIRSALNYAANMGRLRAAPRVPALKREYRSQPRDRVLTFQELGAILGYASFDPPFLRWILLMLATAVRPEAALKLNVAQQYEAEHGVLDLHPVGALRTKKHNPPVPVIPELEPWLARTSANFVSGGPDAIKSMKRRWRTMRRELNLGREVVAKTLRHTVASQLRWLDVPPSQISGLLGHERQEWNRTTLIYAHLNPRRMLKVKRGLSTIWRKAMDASDTWLSQYERNPNTNANCVVHPRSDEGPVVRIAAQVLSVD